MLVTKYYETSCATTSVCGDTIGKDFQVFQSKILFPNENISWINIQLYQTIIEQWIKIISLSGVAIGTTCLPIGYLVGFGLIFVMLIFCIVSLACICHMKKTALAGPVKKTRKGPPAPGANKRGGGGGGGGKEKGGAEKKRRGSGWVWLKTFYMYINRIKYIYMYFKLNMIPGLSKPTCL